MDAIFGVETDEDDSEIYDCDENDNEKVNSDEDDDIINKLINKKGVETVISNEQIKSNKRIEKSKTFLTYERFRADFELYCKETFQLFSISNSIKLKNDTIDESDQESEIEDNGIENDNNTNLIKTQIFRCIR